MAVSKLYGAGAWSMREEQVFLEILKKELAPATGCTEPAAVAYAAAKARAVLGKMPDQVEILVSRNILKNALGVGIPGTSAVGLKIAAAMGITGGNSEAILKVLDGVTPEQKKEAELLAEKIKVSLKDTPKKLYIEIRLAAGNDRADTSCVIIEDAHTNITRIIHAGTTVYEKSNCSELAVDNAANTALKIDEIYDFICSVDPLKLAFLEETIAMNSAISEEGLRGDYGLRVGKTIRSHIKTQRPDQDEANFAVSCAAAAADARMAGSTLPVMTICGSGNQGITATLPVIAEARCLGTDRDTMYRALALSCLVTIHVKAYIGKLSPLCGCGMGSSIGVCCALVYLWGGSLSQIRQAVRNMVADVSGIICDGAKSGCALKIATVTASAFQCAMLALNDSGAGKTDGIVSKSVEDTIRNLGELGNKGMADTDRVILDMMVGNCR